MQGTKERVARSMEAGDVVQVLADGADRGGALGFIRSDNGFIAEAVRTNLVKIGAQTLFIEPGSRWETA